MRAGLEAARQNILDAAEALQAFARGEDSPDATVGGLLIAEFLVEFRGLYMALGGK